MKRSVTFNQQILDGTNAVLATLNCQKPSWCERKVLNEPSWFLSRRHLKFGRWLEKTPKVYNESLKRE